VLRAGDRAPSFELAGVDGEGTVRDPWASGPVVLAFFKTTCPVCQQVAPKVQALADAGARVVAIGEDPPEALARYARDHGQRVPTLSEAPPYEVSDAYGLATVPSLVLVGADGVVVDSVVSWDRDAWNRLAGAAGARDVSAPGDGLPAFRPG
jgi:peroxiredoxin